MSTRAIGELGTGPLAGAALGAMFCNFTGFTLSFGTVGALDTLLFQAYGADPHSPLISVYIQRAILVTTACCLPVTALWVYATPLLHAIHQSPETSHIAGTYILWNILNLYASFLLEVAFKYLQCLGKQTFITLASVTLTACTPFVLWLVVDKWGFGVRGGPLTIGTQSLTLLCIALGYILLKKLHTGVWRGFSRAAFRDWKGYLSLGMPCYLMLLAEWGSFEINAMAAGWIGVKSLDTMAIAMQVLGLAYMIPLGLSTGVSVRTGSMLGQNNPKGAQTVCKAGVVSTMLISLTYACLLILFLRDLAGVFTNDSEILERSQQLSFILGSFAVVDAAKCLCNSLMCVLGYQKYGFCINLLSYCIGIPLGFFLAFQLGLEERGLCLGPAAGTFIGFMLYFGFLSRVDWEKATREAADRIEEGKSFLGRESERGDSGEEKNNTTQ